MDDNRNWTDVSGSETMIVNPRQNQTVQVWYNKRAAPMMPLHGKVGTVAIANHKGKPRNHGVLIDGRLWIVPCGNLRKVDG